MGVFSFCTKCLPPFNPPAAPPATNTGKGEWLWTLLLLIPEPYSINDSRGVIRYVANRLSSRRADLARTAAARAARPVARHLLLVLAR